MYRRPSSSSLVEDLDSAVGSLNLWLCASSSEVICRKEHIRFRQCGCVDWRELQRERWDRDTHTLPQTNTASCLTKKIWTHGPLTSFFSTASISRCSHVQSIFDVGKVKRGAFAAGRKITRIISFSKKKPPRPGDPRISYSDPRQGQTPLHCHSLQ